VRSTINHIEDDDGDDGVGRRQTLVAFLGMLLRRPHDTLAVAAALVAFAMILANALFLQPNPHPAPLFSIKGRQSSSAARESTGAVALPRPRPADLSARTEPARPAEPTAPRTEPATKAEPAARTAPGRSRSEIISDIQRELARRGFYDGPVNGALGGKTEIAIRQFAKSAGLAPGGEVSEAMLKSITRSPLGGKPTAPPSAVASAGDPSAATRPLPSGAGSGPAAMAARTEPSATPSRGDPGGASSKQVKAVQQALADFGYGQVKPTGQFDAATRAAIEEFETVHKLPVSGQISERFLRELAEVTDRPIE
jgi:peptidoglycan hydrolase-like protein with peptidoglycan-binding domain